MPGQKSQKGKRNEFKALSLQLIHFQTGRTKFLVLPKGLTAYPIPIIFNPSSTSINALNSYLKPGTPKNIAI